MGISRDTNEHKQVESAWYWAALIENYDEAIMSVALDGIIVSWNKSAERVYGYTASEIIGRPASVLFPPEHEPKFPEILGRLRRGECIKNEETTRRRKDGSMVDTLATVLPIKNPAKEVVGILVIYHDITLRKRLEAKLLEISADERRRLGHDIHDGLGQYLMGIALKAKILEQNLTKEKSAEAWRAKELCGLVNTAITQTRNLAHGLDPIHVEANGLVGALRNLAAQTRAFFQVECAFVCPWKHLEVDAKTGIALYRITQEAIHNAIRHGKARQINVDLAADDAQLCLKISDNGKGFSPGSKSNLGMGLHIMQFRAKSIGGHLTVESQPNKGARVECTAPPKSWSVKE
jgi:PAS domain S-box-containing protein